MTAAKHTPGPWHAEPPGTDGHVIVADCQDLPVCCVYRQARDDGRAADIAELIARAPDMLAECGHMGARIDELLAENERLREAAEFVDDEIGKHMSAIHEGEYSLDLVVEILCDLQNAARAALAGGAK